MEPAVEEEEEPQKKGDKGISELSLMLDQAHQQTVLVEVLHWMLCQLLLSGLIF